MRLALPHQPGDLPYPTMPLWQEACEYSIRLPALCLIIALFRMKELFYLRRAYLFAKLQATDRASHTAVGTSIARPASQMLFPLSEVSA